MGQMVANKRLELFPHECVAQRDDTRFFAQADRFIAAHIRTEFSAVELAAATNVSLRTLYERFKQAGRRSPHTYIKQFCLRRIREHILLGSPCARDQPYSKSTTACYGCMASAHLPSSAA